MSVTLYAACVPSWLQILDKVCSLIDRAAEYCRDQDLPDEALGGARLAGDMWPFSKQVSQCAYHSAGAVEAMRTGLFRPDMEPVSASFAERKKEIEDASALLKAIEPEELSALGKKKIRFETDHRVMIFTGAEFLLSFSVPNFYFHATTAYAILRSRGLNIGKGDFLGELRFVE